MTLESIQARIRDAAAARTALRIRGGGTKDFYGGALRGEVLDVSGHAGITSYEPTELVVTARGGTALVELEEALRARGQFLPFEPPHFGAGATIGGCVAAGLSGPRRATSGALRDFVLGAKVVDGRGQLLGFGGQVMKNVAGYDVSRLIAGSLGTLGFIAEVSIKVLPRPPVERTCRLAMSEAQAIEAMNRWAGRPLSISATAWHDGDLFVRFSGAEVAVDAAAAALGGEVADEPFSAIREQRHPFFAGAPALWRLSLPSTAAPLGLPGRTLLEWGGGLRWLATETSAEAIREAAARAKGHATLFRSAERPANAFAPLDPLLLKLHRGVKAVFDPAGILNPGRLHPDF